MHYSGDLFCICKSFDTENKSIMTTCADIKFLACPIANACKNKQNSGSTTENHKQWNKHWETALIWFLKTVLNLCIGYYWFILTTTRARFYKLTHTHMRVLFIIIPNFRMTIYVLNIHIMKYPEQEVGITLICATADTHCLFKLPLKILLQAFYKPSPDNRCWEELRNFTLPYCRVCMSFSLRVTTVAPFERARGRGPLLYCLAEQDQKWVSFL